MKRFFCPNTENCIIYKIYTDGQKIDKSLDIIRFYDGIYTCQAFDKVSLVAGKTKIKELEGRINFAALNPPKCALLRLLNNTQKK